MPKIISTKLRKIFWIFKEETTLVCLPAKLLHVLVPLLALISCFVLSWIFVLIFRKGQPSLSFCKHLAWFHNCYCHYCWILIFTLLHVLRITVWEILKGVVLSLFLLFLLLDLWTQLYFTKQEITCHNISGSAGHSSQWMVTLTV